MWKQTDSGKNFVGNFAELLTELHLEKMMVCLVSPWTNRIVEYVVHFIKRLLRKTLVDSSKEKWRALIP